MAIKQRRMSLEAFLKLPEEKPYLEFEDGVVIPKCGGEGKHSALQVGICTMINEVNLPNKVALALPDLRTVYGGRALVPDIAVIMWDRIPRDAVGRVSNEEFCEPPAIAVEIVSPDESTERLVRKSTWSVGHGVRAVLIVDPVWDSIQCFRTEVLPLTFRRSDRIDLSDVVPGLILSIDEVFDELIV